jgi:polysaccharide chain length determinant protein (PEP-CTERM system associated)
MLPGKKFSTADILPILRRRLWYVIVPTFVCGFGALLVSRFLPNLYQSDTMIQVVPQRVPKEYVQPTVTTEVDDRLKAIEQQVMSRTRLEQTILELDLYPDQRRSRPMEDIVGTMRSKIAIELVRGLPRRGERPVDAFKVAFTYHDAQIATRVTERLAAWFIDENARLRGSLADGTNEFLESQLAVAQKRLEEQERKVKEFRERHAGSLPDQALSNMQAIQSMQMQLQAVVESAARDRDRKLMLERLYNDAVSEDARLNAAPPVVVGPAQAPGTLPVNATPEQQLEAARSQLALVETRLTPEHPDIKRLKRIVSDLEQKLAAAPKPQPGSTETPVRTVSSNPVDVERRGRISSMKAEIESLTSQIRFKEGEERRMRAQVSGYQARIEAVPGVESDWTSLNRDYETLQDSYKTLLKKSEESKVAANLERQQIGEQFRVLDAPRVPTRPLSPQRLFINLGGALFGLMLGLGLVGLLEFLDSTYRTEGDVINALTLPVLAVVPQVYTAGDLRHAARRRRLVGAAIGAVLVLSTGVAAVLQLWRYID